MTRNQLAFAGLLAAAVVTAPLASASAHGHHQHDFPLFWPFAVAGAVVGTAAAIATAPIGAITAPPAYYAAPAYGPAPAPYYAPPAPYYPPPGYYGYGYYR